MNAIILFAHGARDPEWALPFKRIQALVERQLQAARSPSTPIQLAFLEFMRPDLRTAVADLNARGARAFTVVPLFMAQGGHLREDVPKLIEAIRQAHPDIAIRLTHPIGEVEPILHEIARWVVTEARSG
jgi:sirohydrochlorin cobaltochelatase